MEDITDVGRALLEEMVEGKNASAVLKGELLSLRSEYQQGVILVFEGINDKGVYFQWVKRVRPNLKFEPFLCRGKRKVLALKGSLDRDKNELGKGVYFFVDRDFDDCQGVAVDRHLFMTDSYSIENYLVSRDILDGLLKINFDCDGKIALRGRICDCFEAAISNFIEVIRDTNRIIYVCRKKDIYIEKIPEKFGKLLDVHIDGAVAGSLSPVEFVQPSRVPTQEEMDQHSEEFGRLDPLQRYRGKFVFGFFRKWLDLLVLERNDSSGNFLDVNSIGSVNTQSFNMEYFATRSGLPHGFAEFVEQISESQ
jgi:hypothetical protein